MHQKLLVIFMLFVSNIFMTYAWYGHLKDFKNKPLLMVVFIAWGIAFFEYIIQVPANRIGNRHFNAVELKTIQEVLSLTVFILFSIFYLKEEFRLSYLLGFALIAAGAFLIFYK
jgi:uncharacterized protein (DUF486 family)